MGIFGQPSIGNWQPQQLPQDPRIGQATKPGFFSAGGNGRNLIGILGDAMAAAGGGRPYYGPAMLQQKQQDRQQQQEDERWANRLAMTAAAKGQQPSTPSTAAKMASELGFKPGTPEWQKFITRYAFTPKLVTVGDDRGGERTLDMSGGAPTGGLPSGYDPNEWEVVQ